MKDSKSWHDEFPMLVGTQTQTSEGDADFLIDGRVRLGNRAFPWHAEIDHTFSGCKATRGKDGVLTITAPTGAEYRYRFDPTTENWYRLVPTEAPLGILALWMAEARESVQQRGLVFGSLYYLCHFLFMKVIAMCVWITILVTALTCVASLLFPAPLHAGVIAAWCCQILFIAFQYTKYRHRLGVSGAFYSVWHGTLSMWPAFALFAYLILGT